MQNSNSEQLNIQSKKQFIIHSGLFTGVLFILLILASFYIGVLYNQKQTVSSQLPTLEPLPKKTIHAKYMGWLKPKESKEWSTVSGESTQTIKYSYKYPQNLFKAQNVRSLYNQSSYFFPDQQSFQSYKECVDNGTLPNEGEDLPRDWEGACDLNNLLFKIRILDGGERKTDGIDPSYLEEYQTSNDTIWTIPTQNGIFGGIGESTFIESSTVYKNHTINLTLYFPSKAAVEKTEEVTGFKTFELLKQIIASFQIVESDL